MPVPVPVSVPGHDRDGDSRPEALGEAPAQTFALWLALALAGLIVLYVCVELRILQQLIAADSSRITLIIVLMYLGCLGHGGWLAWRLSAEQALLARLGDGALAQAHARAPGWAARHLRALRAGGDRGSLNEVLVEQVRGSHEFGWYLAGIMLKLGLLGTVVGFMFMLGSINALSVREFSDLPEMLARMGAGMGTALYTTLAGLIANMALALQYLVLDRSADRYVAQTLLLGESAWVREARPA